MNCPREITKEALSQGYLKRYLTSGLNREAGLKKILNTKIMSLSKKDMARSALPKLQGKINRLGGRIANY